MEHMVACTICGKERWVQFVKGKPTSLRCQPCWGKERMLRAIFRGDKNPNWGGGRTITKDGYIYIWISPDDFFYPMATHRGCVLEHRLVMAKYLNRCLLSWEVVHHMNSIKDDNRLENLKLLPARIQHISDSLLKNRLHQLEIQVKKQAQQIQLLKALVERPF